MRNRLGVLGCLAVLLSACDSPDEPPLPPSPMVVGGSNYVVYSAGEYATNPSDATWYRDLRPVIGTYHLDSLTVQRQLREMRDNGQERIALVLWYEDFGLHADPAARTALAGGPEQDVHGHIVDSRAGQLTARHAANLRRVVELIQQAGYRELVFRFASQGLSRPHDWEEWREADYMKNWSFIVSTKSLVDEVVARGSMSILYDLDVELGGIRHLGETRRYAQRMWRDYVQRYGARNTVGFSISVGQGVVAAAIEDFYRAAMTRPPVYAIDLWGDEYALLQQASRELQKAGEADRPVIIQEVWYNDPQSARAIARARESLELNLRYIMQWPGSRAKGHLSEHYPADYSAYR